MKITIHRGINQIGGCITEIATATTRILIDLGQNLPDSEGNARDSFANQEAIGQLTNNVRAIFYTHYHGDHVGLFKYIPDGVEQHIGEVAKKIMLLKYKKLADAQCVKEVTQKDVQKLETFKTFKAEDNIKVGDITVTPYFVSHSACDAYMFVIEANSRRILHTGDFRGHGYLSKGLLPVIKKIIHKKPIDLLITEGTMLSRMDERVQHENNLKIKAIELMRQYKNVFVLCSSTDMERLASFRAACLEAKPASPFVCDYFQKEVLKIFSETSGEKSDLFDFFKKKDVYDFKETNQKLMNWIENEGCCMLVRATEKFNRYLDFLKSSLNMNETLLIYSMWGGYIDENSPHINKNYLDFTKKFLYVEKLHSSGHASADCLAEICNLVNPGIAIIPIHSEYSKKFSELPITDVLKEKIVTTSCRIQNIEIKI